MAFANLFRSLSAVEEDSTHRSDGEDGRRGRKRKATGAQPDHKRPCRRPQTDATPEAFTEQHSSSRGRGRGRGAGRAPGGRAGPGRGGGSGGSGRHQGQQGKKKMMMMEGRRGGRGSKDVKQEAKPRFMTPEFIEHNTLTVDGRLVCRHFLWGRCLKGEECQLEHLQGYNDLIKEVCKFYVQGYCAKAAACPYMHKSFPCKFFHRRAKCTQGADCKFSHEPLDAITERLLDAALRRDSEQYELQRRAELGSSGGPPDTEGSKVVLADEAVDVPLQPVRPNFYNSTEAEAEQEASGQTDLPDQDFPDGPRPRAAPSEPVCYSVEAVLRPQALRPFPALFSAAPPAHASPSSADADAALGDSATSGQTSSTEPQRTGRPACQSVDAAPTRETQTYAPYSVDAVLRSRKATETSTSCKTPAAPPGGSGRCRPSGPPSDSRLDPESPLLSGGRANRDVAQSALRAEAAAAASVGNAGRHQFPVTRLSAILQQSKTTRPRPKCEPQQRFSPAASAASGGEAAGQGELSAGRHRTSSFQGLFAGPLAAGPSPAPSEAGQTGSRSFSSLFAAPLGSSEAGRPKPPAGGHPAGLGDARSSQAAATQRPDRPAYPRAGSGPEDEPVGRTADQDEASKRPAELQEKQEEKHDTASSKGSPPQSVLRTLFVRLSPFQEEAERRGSIRPSSGDETRDGTAGRAAGEEEEESGPKEGEAEGSTPPAEAPPSSRL